MPTTTTLTPNSLVCLFLTCSLAGCGGSGADTGSTAAPAPVPAPVPAPAPAPPVPAPVPAPAPAPPGSVTIGIDAKSSAHPISPLIYGVNAFDNVASMLTGLNSPINRHGGNATTQYNWKLNASNRAFSWYFESLDEGSATPGQGILNLVSANKQSNADSMVTIPTLGWVAKLGPNRDKLAAFSVAKYGAQQDTDAQWFPDAGNGKRPDGSEITGNDPNDADVPSDATFQQGLVQLLTQAYGASTAGGVKYYIMDNEPGIWSADQRNVHPQGTTLDELFSKTVAHASMVKATDPNAQIVAPEEWGWPNYFASGKDTQDGNVWGGADRQAHGGMDAMPWLLQALKQHDTQSGKRLLDVFSLHYYPQGGEYGNDVSSATQKARNQSTRSLWDASYVDKTWINDKINLIPRMKAWVNQYYPGTKIGITEYSWGADDHINGATAQADVLGIFGREGVDIATRWTAPAPTSLVYKAMQMYRNYDGKKSVFGDQSVKAAVPDPDTVSAFAAVRSSDGALTVMVINKEASASHAVNLQLANFGGGSGTAQRWQLTQANAIAPLSALPYSGSALADTVPAQSITLYVIK